ncbi:MAG TPA: PAS domain S-box protein [Gallionella sp.]
MTLFSAAGRTFSARNLRPFLPLLVYAALVLFIALVYFSSFSRVETLIRNKQLHDLGAIADMKAGQIGTWRDNHRRLGEAFSRDSVLSAEFGQWLAEGAPADGRQRRLKKMLSELQYVNGYKTLMLLDRQGRVRLSLAESSALGEEEVRMALEAMDSRQTIFSDFHRNSYGDKGISIDLVAPLTVTAGGAVRQTGAAVLQIDPATYLYPLIRSWPLESASAETLLVRQEGNEILFLNDVRLREGTALALRMPLDTPSLPSASAVRGMIRIADGVDYRGIPVIAEMRQVTGTPWFVVSKVDRDELLAPVNRLKQWSTQLGMALAGVGGLLVFLWLRNYQIRLENVQARHAAEVEGAMLKKHFEYLTKHANDIIMLADESGKIIEANGRAEQAYGYTREELLQKRISELRDPDDDPAVFQRQLAQIMQLGELRFETFNIRKDGTRFPVESNARIIEVEGNRYLQGVIRDITERKQTEDALRRSETLLKKSQQMAHIGSWELDLKSNLLYWSDENYRIFEVDQTKFGASYDAFLDTVHQCDRDWVNQTYIDSVNTRKPYNVIHRLQFPDQRVKFVQEWCETYYDQTGQPLRSIGTTQDITEQQLAQNALRKTVQQVEDLYNQAPCGYHSLDEDGTIVRINDTELKWLGYAREELVGELRFADLLAPGSRQVFRDNYPAFKQRGYVHDLEYELIRKDGTSFFVSLNATAVYGANGEYLQSRSTLFDISARKQAEEELRLHDAILSRMGEGVVLVRADTGTIVYANPKFEKMFHYAAGEMAGMHVSRLNAPAEKAPEETAQAIMAALEESGSWKGEICNLRKDGSTFWCHANVSTFEHQTYGPVWVSTHQDITEHRQVEKKLQESEERFRTMANNAPIMIWMADAQAKPAYKGCDFFSLGWHNFTGLPLDQTQGRKWLNIVHPDDRARCLAAYQRAFRKQRAFKQEYRVKRRDGAFRWVQDSGVPRFAASGELIGFIGTWLDVTDNKLFEEVRAEMEHVGRLQIAGEMASGLAHELSQPLSAANNYLVACLSRMADQDWDKGRISRAVINAHAQTERAGTIINHLKDMVRKRRQERTPLDINALIRDTVHFMKFDIRQKSVSVVMDFYTLPRIPVSKIEIEQVLINLIRNAISAMEDAPERVLRITTREIESGFILVTVSDTGKGIAADQLDMIFNPFQTSKKDGVGLGLPICRSLVENHGGKIWAESHDGNGAEFNFTLSAGVSNA